MQKFGLQEIGIFKYIYFFLANAKHWCNAHSSASLPISKISTFLWSRWEAVCSSSSASSRQSLSLFRFLASKGNQSFLSKSVDGGWVNEYHPQLMRMCRINQAWLHWNKFLSRSSWKISEMGANLVKAWCEQESKKLAEPECLWAWHFYDIMTTQICAEGSAMWKDVRC